MIAGGMQHWPLRIGTILDHAATIHGATGVVSREPGGELVHGTYADVAIRARRLAFALRALGIAEGDRVATLGWNTRRHLEAWYGIVGAGAICHTVNPRLFEAQIAWIINHADDRLILVDPCFVPLLERIAGQCLGGRRIVVMGAASDIPTDTTLAVTAYEDLIAGADPGFRWIEVEETAPAGLCYTSGTTGDPKGVVYTHRSNVLHALMSHGPDVLALSTRSTVLPIVPMYHANAWALAFAAPMAGAKLVLPGARLDAESICELMQAEGVTIAAGVPTVWIDALPRLREQGRGTLERILTGGAATPRWLLEGAEALGITVVQAWGMTEMSPIGSVSAPHPAFDALEPEKRLSQRLKQGAAIYGVELRIVAEDGSELIWDGKAEGRLQARGPCVTRAYFRGAGDALCDGDGGGGGWFDTGDIASIDAQGYVAVTDRAKDVIKSGGEWISSIALEGEAASHPAIREAAAIGVPHERWGERPLLVVVRAPGSTISVAELLAWLGARVVKWWLPEQVMFVDTLPHTATGKLDKKALRALVARGQVEGGANEADAGIAALGRI